MTAYSRHIIECFLSHSYLYHEAVFIQGIKF